MKTSAYRTIAGAVMAVALLAGVVGLTSLLTACNTVKGVGRDITGTSEGVEDMMFGSDNTPPRRH